MSTLAQKIRRRAELKAQIEMLQKKLTTVEDSIREEVGENNTLALKTSRTAYVEVSLNVAVREGWKTDKLLAELGADAKKFRTQTKYSTLRVKPITKDEYDAL